MISDPKLPLTENSPTVGEIRSSPGASSHNGRESLAAPAHSVTGIWLRRIGVLLFVFLCATLGVMLMILPWRPEWSDNPLLLSYPAIRAIISSGFARGFATGLGVLNVWIGFWEAIQYRED